MRTAWFFPTILIVLLTLTGCATLFRSTKDDIQLDANVPEVRVYVDGLLSGKTPVTLTISRSVLSGHQNIVRFEKEGYKTVEFRLKKEIEPIAFANTTTITFWAVDALSGAMMKYSPTEYHIQMESATGSASAEARERRLTFAQFSLTHQHRILEALAASDVRGLGPYAATLVATTCSTFDRHALARLLVAHRHDLVRSADHYLLNEQAVRIARQACIDAGAEVL